MTDPSATALSVLGASALPFMIFGLVGYNRAIRAVPGSHQRWLWGGVYRMGMIMGMMACGCIVVVAAIDRDWTGVVLFGVQFFWWILLWKRWADHNSDDDFWNSLGKKVKGFISSLRPGSAPVTQGS